MARPNLEERQELIQALAAQLIQALAAQRLHSPAVTPERFIDDVRDRPTDAAHRRLQTEIWAARLRAVDEPRRGAVLDQFLSAWRGTADPLLRIELATLVGLMRFR
ncbi:MAG: hypothetical protein FJX57_04760 [Alphaproteobacteria bacterium]|nr:hypothetical protein [Alphaproteobacteria bacterium]